MLKGAVIGLGFGINLTVLIKASQDNALITTIFVVGTLLLGYLIAKWLGLSKKIGLLIASGTAICGGSAIAAVGSVIKADSNQISISTGAIFLLNALGLIIFPIIGVWLGLSQQQFGTWAAIAIHDMSSVVGASAKYGEEALQIASVTKMLRVLWIIPMALGLVWQFSNKESFKIPLFIVGFLIASTIYSLFPAYQYIYEFLYKVAKQLMVASLFLIGSSLSINNLKNVGTKAILQAVMLWVVVCCCSLGYVYFFE